MLLGLLSLIAAAATARRDPGRFADRAVPLDGAGPGVLPGFWVRRVWYSFFPRPGTDLSMPHDPEALAQDPSLTWIGHSTFLVRMDGATFLTDPVFSERAGPVSFAGPRRRHPPGVPLEALPPVDFVVLSHDHYDHADLPSLRALARRGTRFLVPLGLGDLVREAGGEAVELNWWESVEIAGLTVHCVPARHWSGRSLTGRNARLWGGWVVAGPTRRFYHAGDTGYSADLAEIGARLGPIDLAAVPIGALRPEVMMRAVHATPEEALRLGLDVGARRMVAMHFGTFDLADEPPDEPVQRFRTEAARLGLGGDRSWVLGIGETRRW